MFGNSGALGSSAASIDHGTNSNGIANGKFINSWLFNPAPIRSRHDVE